MKHVLLAQALAVGLAFSATPIGGATVPRHLDAVTGKPPCSPKITKIDGHQAVMERGPVTASLRLGGKTYNFKNGHCVPGNGQYFSLDLGVAVSTGGANEGKPIAFRYVQVGGHGAEDLYRLLGVQRELSRLIDLVRTGRRSQSSWHLSTPWLASNPG
jgi:hypothetical protein